MKNVKLKRSCLETDVLIIGGGTAGCYAAIKLGAEKELRVLVAEKRISNAAAAWPRVSMRSMPTFRTATRRPTTSSMHARMRRASSAMIS